MNSRPGLYNTTNLLAIAVIYLVILAGGVVRGSGSGMGCPDWPKCFGKWVPPTKESELPKDYLDRYVEERRSKNERLATVADFFGLNDFAKRLNQDDSIYAAERFNATHTWVEYINRLLGALSGILILLSAGLSFKNGAHDKSKLWSLMALVAVIVVGALGAFVVSTNLIPFLITIHFLLAFTVLLFLFLASKYNRQKGLLLRKNSGLLIVAIGVLVVQIILGTQLREGIDILPQSLSVDDKLRELFITLFTHKGAAVVLVGLVLLYGWKAYRNENSRGLRSSILIVLVAIIQIGVGVILSERSLPGLAQALHVLISSILFGILVLTVINRKEINDPRLGLNGK